MSRRWLFPAALVALTVALPALAQTAPDAPPPLPERMSMTEIMHTGGVLMYVLGAMSVAALAFIIYFAVTLRREAVVPRDLIRDLRDALRSGREEEARLIADKSRSCLAAIAAVGLDYLRRTPEPDSGLLKEIIEGEGGRQAAMIQDQTQYLMDIAVIAPMVGLLGTVMGMLTAFNAVALDIAKAKPMVLAGGVSQALITTAAGLIVGIPAMAFYAYFRGRVSKLVSGLESSGAELLTLLLPRSKS